LLFYFYLLELENTIHYLLNIAEGWLKIP